ncbi:MAG: PrsW family glutamic-type intramembrane protease [Bacteroidia bacterium]
MAKVPAIIILHPMELLALALAPIVFIFTFVYLKDEYEREPLKYLVITFILGICTALPVLFIGEYLQILTGTSQASDSFGVFIYAFFVVAFTEEVMKFLVLRFYNYPHKEFDEPYDGIMYGVAVSLGFAAIENVLYVFNSEGSEIQTGIVRMFTAVPAHAMFGIMMGYFMGRAKFIEEKNKKVLEMLKGLGVAIFFHGVYDYFLFLGEGFLAIFAFASLAVGLFLATRAMRIHVEESPHKDAPSMLDDFDLPAGEKEADEG